MSDPITPSPWSLSWYYFGDIEAVLHEHESCDAVLAKQAAALLYSWLQADDNEQDPIAALQARITHSFTREPLLIQLIRQVVLEIRQAMLVRSLPLLEARTSTPYPWAAAWPLQLAFYTLSNDPSPAPPPPPAPVVNLRVTADTCYISWPPPKWDSLGIVKTLQKASGATVKESTALDKPSISGALLAYDKQYVEGKDPGKIQAMKTGNESVLRTKLNETINTRDKINNNGSLRLRLYPNMSTIETKVKHHPSDGLTLEMGGLRADSAPSYANFLAMDRYPCGGFD